MDEGHDDEHAESRQECASHFRCMTPRSIFRRRRHRRQGAHRVSDRSFTRSWETVFGRQRQKAPNCL
jgi:hypothetical protein